MGRAAEVGGVGLVLESGAVYSVSFHLLVKSFSNALLLLLL